MEAPRFSQDMIVGDVLARWPQVVQLFMRRRWYCVGCSLARFETLGEVSATYGLPYEALLAELQQAVRVE